MLDTAKNELKKYVVNDETQKLFTLLYRRLKDDSTYKNQFISLNSRFRRIQKKERSNTIKYSSIEIEYSKISNACIDLIDLLEEHDFKIPFSINHLLRNPEVNSIKLKREEIQTIFEYIQELELRVDSDYELFRFFETHSFHKNACALLESRDLAKDKNHITIMDFDDNMEKYNLKMVELVNLEVNTRKSIIEGFEENAEIIFEYDDKDPDHSIRYKKYAELVKGTNERIDQAYEAMQDEDDN